METVPLKIWGYWALKHLKGSIPIFKIKDRFIVDNDFRRELHVYKVHFCIHIIVILQY